MTNKEDAVKKVVTTHARVTAARDELADAVEARAEALRTAHDDGRTWAELGKAIGLSGVRAEQASLDAEGRAARRRRKPAEG